jgi:hypothetical protein
LHSSECKSALSRRNAPALITIIIEKLQCEAIGVKAIVSGFDCLLRKRPHKYQKYSKPFPKASIRAGQEFTFVAEGLGH